MTSMDLAGPFLGSLASSVRVATQPKPTNDMAPRETEPMRLLGSILDGSTNAVRVKPLVEGCPRM